MIILLQLFYSFSDKNNTSVAVQLPKFEIQKLESVINGVSFDSTPDSLLK